ncbi:hypothetical protein ECC02_009369 [Trypanosoma cruzi]|uniref:Mucin TcMUCII n=1 Tax=Trypanosoma cruzi TaxID=5693 RepID=A0A7J6XU98_TRYCR|nr:hypothetical protein ECC02_009369 [Trypanosoma cruzi]
MMTCRLLCALLVLALCCCPSVCATVANQDKDAETKQDSDLEDNQMEEPKLVTDQHSASSSSPQKITVEGTEHARNTAKHTLETTVAVTGTAGSQNNSSNTKDQDHGQSTKEETENTKTVTVNKQNKKYAPTTTTEEPTTTTTTTTTQAPSGKATTTEAPTTTTTRAPSRLREIDGSFSGSAWVCAPLLLAASALAYTTLG